MKQGIKRVTDKGSRDCLTVLSNVVRLLRKRADLSQEELAKEADITPKTVSRLESGEKVADETLRSIGVALTKAVGYSVDLLDQSSVARLFQKLCEEPHNQRAPTALETVSKLNLRESGEISDERGSLNLHDLYITRDCEIELIDELQASKRPLFVTGRAGCGKTSTLWRIASRLLAEGADVLFFRADFLVSDDGFREFQSMPFAVGSASYVVIDTVDSVVGRSEARRRLEAILDECSLKGYSVATAIRPLEKSRYFSAEKSIFIPDGYNEQEFTRAVESHVRAFYRLKDLQTIATRVEEILSIASGGTPVVELAYQPLTLRMLFSVYAPNEIPTEVNSMSLYLEFWRRRVEADWRAGRPEPEPNSRNLARCAAWIAEFMLAEGSIQTGRDRINLAITQGAITSEDVSELATRGILHVVTAAGGHEGFEFFHQSFFEFAAAWSMVAGVSSITLETLYGHLKETQFDSLRIPVLQNALALGQMTGGNREAVAQAILLEILRIQPESLIFSALFAVAQLPSWDSALEGALKVALRDRKNAAQFIRLTPSTPLKRLAAVWHVFRDLYDSEQREKPARNPRAVRAALAAALPRMIGRLPELTAEVLTFLQENTVVDDVAATEDNGTSTELRNIATLLFEASRQDPEKSCEIFIGMCLGLRQRNLTRQNDLLLNLIITFCQSEFVPRRVLREIADILDGIENTNTRRVRAFLEALEWDAHLGDPYSREHLHDILDAAHVKLLQSWSRGKPISCWENMWTVFSTLCEENGANGQFLALWVRELWEKLDRHPLEPDGNMSFRGFEFLSGQLATALKSSNSASRTAAQKVCVHLQSQRLLLEVFARVRSESESVLTETELLDAFLPSMIAESTDFDPDSEPFKSQLQRKSARKKLIASAVELIGWRPELWPGMTKFLVNENKFYLLAEPIGTYRIKAQPLDDRSSAALLKIILCDLESDKVEDRHRAARIAYLALSKEMGLDAEYETMRMAFEREKEPRIAALLAMCAIEVGSSSDEIQKACKFLLSAYASGDQYMRDRVTSALVRAMIKKSIPLIVDEFLDTIRADLNLRKLCEAARLVAGIAASDSSAAQRIADFLFLNPTVNNMGRTVLTSFRIQSRAPLIQWMQHLSARSVLDLIREIPHLDMEIAMLIADASLRSRHQDAAVEALQEVVRERELKPELARKIGNLVRSRTVNIRPLRQTMAA